MEASQIACYPSLWELLVVAFQMAYSQWMGQNFVQIQPNLATLGESAQVEILELLVEYFAALEPVAG